MTARGSGRRLCGLVLAAGGSRRFGRPKQLATVDGVPLVKRAVALARCACDLPVIVVTGADGERVAECLSGLEVRIVPNPDWQDGLSGSLRAGIGAVDAGCDAVLVLPCDLPHLHEDDVDELVAAWREHPDRPAAARFDGVLGIPAILPAVAFDKVTRARGDEGARSYLRRGDVEVTAVSLTAAGRDVDVPGDLD